MVSRTARVCALGVALLGALSLAIVPLQPAAAASTWLDRFNAWRASANLPALIENTTWSAGDYSHSLYMVKNDLVTHYETPGVPYYTAAGDTAARNSNIEVSSTTSATDDGAIDWWMGAPFHALGMMDPRLTQTGFGAYRQVKSGWQTGFSVDVLRGNSFSGGTYPVFFPGDGSVEPLRSYSGNEFPDPLQACPGYSVPTGLPVFVQVGGNVSTTVGAHAFTGGGVPLQHCVIDSNSPSVGSSLTSRGAVILIPRQPLQPGVLYQVALTVNNVPYTWSFGVSGDNSITSFSCTSESVSAAATQSTTEFNLNLTARGCNFNKFDVQVFDTTLNQGWFDLTSVAASSGSGTTTADGYPGRSYQFRTRAHSAAGSVSAWSAAATTQVSPTASRSMPFTGLYTLDGWGGVHANNSGPLAATSMWPGWSIARAARGQPGANAPQAGFVLDGFGGLHPYGLPGLSETSGSGSHYWGWDIARDFAFLPDGTGGFVLDGFGGLHPFRVNGSTAPLTAQGYSYWGWDIARKVVIFPDGTGGYVLDGWGGVHPFGINGPAPAAVTNIVATSYWPGWDIARDVQLVPGNGNHTGYVLDGFGGLHPFHPTGDGSASPGAITVTAYWGGWDIARGLYFLPGSPTAGYTLDGYGGLHPFGGAPTLVNHPYWGGWDIAKTIWGA